jgi:hypothetical protein
MVESKYFIFFNGGRWQPSDVDTHFKSLKNGLHYMVQQKYCSTIVGLVRSDELHETQCHKLIRKVCNVQA